MPAAPHGSAGRRGWWTRRALVRRREWQAEGANALRCPPVDALACCFPFPARDQGGELAAEPAYAANTTIKMGRSEEHTSELQSLMRISYAVFCLKKKNKQHNKPKIVRK